VTRTAAPVVALAGTHTVSPTITQTIVVLFHFNLVIYNSSGEEVKTLNLGVASAVDPAADFSLGSKSFAPQGGQMAAIIAGGRTFLWAGDNNGGQPLKSGIYYVKLDAVDQFGSVVSVTHEIVVLASGQFYSVIIYNSAGEEIRRLTVAASGLDAPSRIQPDKSSMAVGPGAGSAGSITFDLGNGASVTWDGTNAQGVRVAGGSYLAQLVVAHDGAPKNVASAAVVVINTAEGLLSGAVLAPNPLDLTSLGGGRKTAILRLNAPAGTEALGRVYNIAGEIVLMAANSDAPGELRFDFSEPRVSSGVYVVAVTARSAWGTTERRNFKLVIMR
jgi:hypothetical protein